MEKTLGQKIRRNTFASVIAWFVQQGSKFILVPIIIDFVDYDGYALISIAFLLMGYFTLQVFGINTVFVNHTADCYAKRDFERMNGLLSTGMVVSLVLGVAAFLAVWFCTDALVGFFDIAPSRLDDARYVVRCMGVISAGVTVLGLYRAALTGIQRIDAITMTHMCFSLFEFVAIIALLYAGFGIRAVMTVYTLSQLGFMGAVAIQTRWILPELRVNLFRSDWRALRSIASLGGKMQVLALIGLVLHTMDGLGLARMEGLTFAGVYLVARRLLQRAQGLPTQAFGPLLPASADLHSRKDYAKLANVFSSAMRILSVFSAYMFAYVAVNGDLVILGYIGPEKYQPQTVFALRFLCASTFIHILTGPGTSMLKGAGKVSLEMTYQILAIILYLVLFNVAQHYGNEEWTILSFPIALGVSSLIFILMSNGYFRAPFLCPFSSTILLLAAAPLLAWVVRLGWEELPLSLPQTRWFTVLELALMGTIYTGLFGIAAWFLPGLSHVDKDQLIRFIPMGRRIAAFLNFGGLKKPD